MLRNSKRTRWRDPVRADHNRRDFLVQSLGTPDGLHAVSELLSNVVFASALLFLILSKNSFVDTFLRIAAALAFRKILFRVEGRGRNGV